LQDWLRFSVAFWHTFRGDGGDPFGSPTKSWPWEDGTNSLAMAAKRSKPDPVEIHSPLLLWIRISVTRVIGNAKITS